MNKIYFVAFLLLHPLLSAGASLEQGLQRIETQWAKAYYGPKAAQGPALDKVLAETEALAQQYPGKAETLIWQAVIISTRAGVQNGVDALAAIHEARDLLTQAIGIDPDALEGAAYVNLGSLYYRVPSWPVAFGDDEKAEEMFQTALRIKPDSIDANYFYGDFLLTQGKKEQAAKHFKTAIAAPVRREQQFADNSLQNEAKHALKTLQSQEQAGVQNGFPLLSARGD